MRLRKLILWDIKLQVKSGFYFIYAILTVFYFAIMFALPVAWRNTGAAVIIFSDPAIMGMFFMGAIILLEKSQKIPCALAVSPVLVTEYIVSKVISLCTISIIVAAALAIAAGSGNIISILLGTALSAVTFTLAGIIIASKISSLNQFFLLTVPVEIIGFVPAILHLLGISPEYFKNYPANVYIDMVSGNESSWFGFFFTIILIGVLFFFSRRSVIKMWNSVGGTKL